MPSIARSSVLVRAVGSWYKPGCSIVVPKDVCVSGAEIGASEEANGVISRGRFFF